MLSQRVIYSITFYLLVVALLFVTRPALAFNPDGSVKSFGVGEGSSIFSVAVLVCAVAVLCFYAFCIVDIVFK